MKFGLRIGVAGKVSTYFLKILLKILSTEIINIYRNFDHFLVKNKFTTPT